MAPPITVKAEALLGSWTNITDHVFGEGRGKVDITRGKSNEAGQTDPSKAVLSLKNQDGRFCPRLPTGPYFGIIGRNTPLRVSTVDAVDDGPRYDTISDGGDSSSVNPREWEHTPRTAPKGVLVVIIQNGASDDDVASVAYGGVALSEVTGSPLAHATGAEDGALYAYFLGDGIPTGPQTVTVTPNGLTRNKHFWAITIGADTTTTVVDDTTTLESGGVANPSVTLTTTKKTLNFAILHSGQDDITGVTPAAGHSRIGSNDFISQVGDVIKASLLSSAGSPTIGWTATSEEAAVLGIAIRNGTDYARHYGEVAQWPVEWDPTGTDVWTSIESAGVLRRLQQGKKPLRSALFRAVTDKVDAIVPVTAYWSCEDADGATRFASGLSGGSPSSLITAGTSLASLDGAGGSDQMPVFTLGDQIWFPAPVMGLAWPDPWRVDWMFFQESSGSNNVLNIDTSGGDIARFQVQITATTLTIECFNDSGTSIQANTVSSLATTDLFGKWLRFYFSVAPSSATQVDYLAKCLAQDGTEIASWDVTVSGSHTAGRPQQIGLGGLGGNDRSIGHITIAEDDVAANWDPFGESYHGFNGELASDRVVRLCTEEDVASEIVGATDFVIAMGAQRPGELVALLRECEAADGGQLYEPREFLGLAYRTRESMYNQTEVLSVPYGPALSAVPKPVDDDQRTRNDVTAKRPSGSSARVVLEEGRLSIQDPPDGVGTYTEDVAVNIDADSGLDDQASWRLHLGTVDEARYPTIQLGLHNAYYTANPTKHLAALMLDMGDRILITDPPAWLPPDDIDQLILGYTESLTQYLRTLSLNCAPASPWNVMVWDSFRWESSATVLDEDLDTTETAITVAITDGPLWTTTIGGTGSFDIYVGGERMTVTAITGASSPQTFTVTRSVNGVVKTHLTGAPVRLWTQPIWAL